MADRVFCIDFGSAYTKVALRHVPSAASTLVRDPTLSLDDGLTVCIPSTVILDRGTEPPGFSWGMAAAFDRKSGGGIRVYRNWKRGLFSATPIDGTPVATIDAFLQSPELLELAARMGVPVTEVSRLHQLLAAARAFGGTEPAPVKRKSAPIEGYLALNFFKRLRAFLLTICKREGVSDAESIPARVSIPAFAAEADPNKHYGCRVLTAALKQSGWPFSEKDGFISEPYANVIGILTQGVNCINADGSINLGQMFGKGLLKTTLAHPQVHPDYRAVVADVGAFTTDFAALTLRTGGQVIFDPQPHFEVRHESVPDGIGSLDEAIIDYLQATSPQKAEWLTTRATPQDWEDIHRRLYNDGEPFRSVEAGGKIGDGREMNGIKEVIRNFGTRLSEYAAKFCNRLDPIPFQELVLTGGGCQITAVRRAIIHGCQDQDISYRKVHLPFEKGARGHESLIVTLNSELTRGGTALGGASLYFEPSYQG